MVQAKLSVGPVDDAYEREADAVAAEVVRRMSSGETVDRLATEETGEAYVQRSADGWAGSIGVDGGAVPDEVGAAIDRARPLGRPLPGPLRRDFEEAFGGGTDFSGVRLHVGAESDRLNGAVSARAFTSGSDIFVRRSDYSTEGESGRSLLAHELTHVIQQGGAG